MTDRRIRLSDEEISLLYEALRRSGVNQKLERRFESLMIGRGLFTRGRTPKPEKLKRFLVA